MGSTAAEQSVERKRLPSTGHMTVRAFARVAFLISCPIDARFSRLFPNFDPFSVHLVCGDMSSSAEAGPSGRSNGVRVKSERQTKVKAEKVANGRTQRNRVEEEDDDGHRGGRRASRRQQEDGSDEEDGDEEEGTPHGNKRQRVNDNGDSRSSRAPSEDAEEEEDDEPAAPVHRVKTQPRDVDGSVFRPHIATQCLNHGLL